MCAIVVLRHHRCWRLRPKAESAATRYTDVRGAVVVVVGLCFAGTTDDRDGVGRRLDDEEDPDGVVGDVRKENGVDGVEGVVGGVGEDMFVVVVVVVVDRGVAGIRLLRLVVLSLVVVASASAASSSASSLSPGNRIFHNEGGDRRIVPGAKSRCFEGLLLLGIGGVEIRMGQRMAVDDDTAVMELCFSCGGCEMTKTSSSGSKSNSLASCGARRTVGVVALWAVALGLGGCAVTDLKSRMRSTGNGGVVVVVDCVVGEGDLGGVVKLFFFFLAIL